MNLSDLEIFVEVARSGSITQAAKNRHVSQPAVSRSISEFEQELNCRLFDRIGRNLYLNAFGKAVFPYARQALVSYTNLHANLADLGGPHLSTITVGIATEHAEWQNSFVHWFFDEYPNVNLRVVRVEPERLKRMLHSNECDFGISSSVIRSRIIECTLFRTEPIGVVLARNHRLARNERISIYELEDEPFLMSTRNSDNRRFTTELCERAGFTPNIMLEVDLPGLVEELRCITNGVCFTSREGYEHLLSSSVAGSNRPWMNLITFRLLKEDFCVRNSYICTPTERYLPRVSHALIDHIKDACTVGLAR